MIQSATEPRSLAAARDLIREHFEAHSEAHDPSQISAIIDKLPSPYVPPDGGLWVAWDGDEAVGCVALQQIADDVGEVKRMYVRPQFRRMGLGRLILDRLEAHAREQACLPSR